MFEHFVFVRFYLGCFLEREKKTRLFSTLLWEKITYFLLKTLWWNNINSLHDFLMTWRRLSSPVVFYSVFSLTWPAAVQIYWNKRKRLHKKRVQLPQDWFGTPTWPPFHCFGTPIWHVKTHNNRLWLKITSCQSKNWTSLSDLSKTQFKV